MRMIPLATIMAVALACSITAYAGDTGGNGGSMQSTPVESTVSPHTQSSKQKPPDPWDRKAKPQNRTSSTPANLKGKPVNKSVTMPPDPWDKKAKPQNKTSTTPTSQQTKPANTPVNMPPDPLGKNAKPQNKTSSTPASLQSKPANTPVNMPPDPWEKNAGKVK